MWAVGLEIMTGLDLRSYGVESFRMVQLRLASRLLSCRCWQRNRDLNEKNYVLECCEPASGSHNFFRMIKIISFSSDSGLGSASTTVIASQ